ncbi:MULTISPECIES: stage V sporulation protein B [Shouchella]|uniref:Stage V sporulation protein B n=1 Tax=Shouchella clausii TaxID=79880 RepID=A0A268P5C6_SHOCL|nr:MULTISPECIES: stage V sporulation protein B [Shouchella]MCM3313817.1 stage V sporulation protein B [Psychrobacillus sp. MER TA 17]KKI85072.1 stage V sporulation protein B [Shouchella clausii]MCM3379015.1 stage V sporulation protein B [Shouchella rhizosphaerae]PAD18497.1 stage V sporulation protein B [Shouchella clausii]PAD46976.1 stage V sporulation protein B [Shouchella clausii]
MNKQTFLKGTFILIAAGFITKLLGFINRIVMARMIGAEGVGLYMMAVPTMLLLLTLTQLGLPVAIAKLVAEAEAKGEVGKTKKILAVALAITGSLSIVFTTAILVLAPLVAQTLLTDARALYPLLAVAPIVPIIAVSSVLRGYFQGRQNMKPTAYSQVLEQVVRISLIAVFTAAFMPYGLEYAAAGAMISAGCGELASLLYMLYLFKSHKPFRLRRQFFSTVKSGRKTASQLLAIALPTTGSRLIGTVALFFEPIVVAQSLALAGVATIVATQQYGLLVGYVMPLLTLPTFITYSLSVSLLPSLSEAAANKQKVLIHHRLEQALRMGLLSGGICVVVLYVFASELTVLMYNAPHAASLLQVMAPFALFLYLQGPLAAALQALDYAKASMVNSFIGAIVKTLAIFALASSPSFGIMGAALAIVTGFVLVTLLHIATLAKTTGFVIHAVPMLKLVLLIVITGYAGMQIDTYLFNGLPYAAKALASIAITCMIYVFGILALKLLSKEELKRLPFIKKFM